MFNNEDLNQVTWEQRVMEGDPKFEASQDIPNVPYHKFAELIGLKGIYVDTREPWRPAWDEALPPPAGRAGGEDRSRSAAAAAAHHAGAGEAFTSTLMKGDQARAISSPTPRARCLRTFCPQGSDRRHLRWRVMMSWSARRARVPSNGPACQQRTNAHLWF